MTTCDKFRGGVKAFSLLDYSVTVNTVDFGSTISGSNPDSPTNLIDNR